MVNFDLTPLYRTTVGFDRLGGCSIRSARSTTMRRLSAYNIELVDENTYRISMAVAGFGTDDLNLEAKENTLTIRGRSKATRRRAPSSIAASPPAVSSGNSSSPTMWW